MSSRLSSLLGRLGGLFLATVVLAGCGGSVVDPFRPERIVSLGDEYSYMSDAGRKFTVNKVGDCKLNPIWNQQFVESYGFSFPQCPNGRDASRLAVLQAVPQATALPQPQAQDPRLSLQGQIDQVSPSPGPTDLVLLLIGANDIWRAYEEDPAAAATRIDAAATEVHNQVLRLVNLKSKVILLTVPDQGSTPAGLALGAAASGRLNDLTKQFNEKLRSLTSKADSPTSSGRNVGLVLAQDLVWRMQQNRTQFGLANVDQGACRASQGLDCDDTTADPNYVRFLYADGRYLSTEANAGIARLAETRARNNPF